MSLLGFNIWTRGRRGPRLSHWSTHPYPTWFCAKHSLDNWCPTLCPGPFSDHRYQPKGLLQLLESSLPACSTTQQVREQENKCSQRRFLPANGRWAWRGNTPAALSQASPTELFALCDFRSPHWHQRPMVPGVTGLTMCFSSVYPSFLSWPLSHYFLSQYSCFSHVPVWDLLLREPTPRQESEESWWMWEFGS